MEITVNEESRLDVFLVANVPNMSRAKARVLTEAGQIRVNGHRARKSHRVVAGDVVRIDELPAPTDFEPVPNAALPLTVLYEDANFVVVDKPAGMPSHPLEPNEDTSLVNALVARYPEMQGVGYRKREPGILHRLDTDTSGVLVAARNTATFDVLRDALRDGKIEKTYLALVEGDVSAPRVLDASIAPHPKDKKKVKVLDQWESADPGARASQTQIEKSERLGAFSLVHVQAPRAGRHQVRAHLAHAGHPLVGDLLYGGPALAGLSRHFLHAATIELDHPTTHTRVVVEAPMPAELSAVLAGLK